MKNLNVLSKMIEIKYNQNLNQKNLVFIFIDYSIK